MSQSVEDNAKPGGGALSPRAKLLLAVLRNYSLCILWVCAPRLKTVREFVQFLR
jgi:hypothetical protein